MATNTTKLALTKPDGTDLVDVAVLNNNFDKIDTASGAFICTSTTRPASPWNGQVIFETDTLNALVYRTSTSSWNILGGSTVGSNPPANAGNGNFWWDSDNGKLYIYYNDGNTAQWVSANSTASGTPVVANQAGRDSLFPSPIQGNAVFRNDTGYVETYHALYNESTNPGGRDAAGWYTTEKNDGFIPVRPASIVIGTGSGSVNSLGTVTFTGATSVSLNDVFTNTYNTYRIMMWLTSRDSAASGSQVRFRYRNNGTDRTTASTYYQGGYSGTSSGTNATYSIPGDTYHALGDYEDLNSLRYALNMDVYNTRISTRNTVMTFSAMGGLYGTAPRAYQGGGTLNQNNLNDGFTIYPSAGNMTGELIVYGYND